MAAERGARILPRRTDHPIDHLPDDIDPGIRPVVELLNRHGLRTTASCQGGEGHAWAAPTVRVAPLPGMDFSMEPGRQNIVEALISAGYTGFSVKIVTHYQDSIDQWRPVELNYYEVEFWSDWKGLRNHDPV